MRYQKGYDPIRFGEDERKHLTRGHIAGLLLVFFVVTLGTAMLGAALTCPC